MKIKTTFTLISTLLISLLSACGSGGGGSGEQGPTEAELAAAALAGNWYIYQASGPNDCGDEVSVLSNVEATITASGETITATLSNGTLSGSLSGEELTLTGTLTEEPGTSAVTLTFTVLSGSNAAGGSSEFVYSETGFTCSGELIIGAIKRTDATGAPVTADIDLSGDWAVTETSGANSCEDAEGTIKEYDVTVSQSSGLLYISGPAWALEGEVRGSTALIAGTATEAGASKAKSTAYTGIDRARPQLTPAHFSYLANIAGFTVASDGNSFTGIGGFTYVDTLDYDCVGGYTISGTRYDYPAQPTEFTVTTVSSSSLELNWQDNADNETGYYILRQFIGFAPAQLKVTVQSKSVIQAEAEEPEPIILLPANSTSYTDTGLQPGRVYRYIVEAVNEFGGTKSVAVSGTTDSEALPPEAEVP